MFNDMLAGCWGKRMKLMTHDQRLEHESMGSNGEYAQKVRGQNKYQQKKKHLVFYTFIKLK